MRKNFGAKTWLYPMPVLIIATYNEDDSADAMNAAWGGIHDTNQIGICLEESHKTVQNIFKRKAFTVSIADAKHMAEADYLGIVSGNQVSDKVKKANLHTIKSEKVDAPIIEEFALTLECSLVSYDQSSGYMVGNIVNVSIDDCILGEDGQIDLNKFEPITYDPIHHTYIKLGDKVGNAFSDGKKIK